MKKFIFIIFGVSLILFQSNAIAQNPRLEGTTPYFATDEVYQRFVNAFPSIGIYQKGTISESKKLLLSIAVLSDLLNNYSPEFLSSAGITAIILHENSNDRCVGTPSESNCAPTAGWAANGILNLVASGLSMDRLAKPEYLAIRNPRDCGDDSGCLTLMFYLNDYRQTLHHELFHAMDNDMESPAWVEISPPGWVQTPGVLVDSRLNLNLIGFLSNYAATSVVEDRAETFGYVMTSAAAVTTKAGNDSYIKSKVLALKVYLEGLCGTNVACTIPVQFLNFR